MKFLKTLAKRAHSGLGRMMGIAGYEGAYWTRERPNYARYRAQPSDEDQHMLFFDRQTVVLSLEDLYRNNELMHGVINRMADYTVHTGVWPQAQTKSREWNRAAEAYFRNWSKIADFRQRIDFTTMQWQTIVDRFIRGESGFVINPNDSGQLQPIDMMRVQTPAQSDGDSNIRQGIKFDGDGRKLGYYICERDKNGTIDRTSSEYVRAENFIHISAPWRADQARGIPEAASIIPKISDLREADKYIQLKIKNEAKLFLKIKKEGGQGFVNDIPRNSRTVTNLATGEQEKIVSHEWGEEWRMRAGDDVESFVNTTPNAEYIPYLELQVKIISAALGLPWEFMLMVFTQGSFSAQRTALLHALHRFTGLHAWMSRTLCARVWNWRIAKAIKEGDLDKAPVDGNGVSEWWKCEWSLPSMGWVDPEASVKSDVTAWQLGSRSLKNIASAAGRDLEDVLDEKKHDILTAVAIADEINTASPSAGVTWRDIINAGQTGALINAASDASTEEQNAKVTK